MSKKIMEKKIMEKKKEKIWERNGNITDIFIKAMKIWIFGMMICSMAGCSFLGSMNLPDEQSMDSIDGMDSMDSIDGIDSIDSIEGIDKETGNTETGNKKTENKEPENSESSGNKEAKYMFVWMSDTQVYSERYPEIYQSMTEWIAEHAQEENIKFVFHTGDVTNQSEDQEQWVNADAAMKKIDNVVPYSILAGNHDLADTESFYDHYLPVFGKSRFSYNDDILWYKEGEASAQILPAGSHSYLILALGYRPDEEMVAWANEILAVHQGLPAILTTHEYIVDGERSETGQRLFQEIVSKNPNVHLVLCGHNHDVAKIVSEIDDNEDGITDRMVYQLLADYQATPNGGNGFMRLLSVDENAMELHVSTYSPYLDAYNYFDATVYPEKDDFTFSIEDWFH